MNGILQLYDVAVNDKFFAGLEPARLIHRYLFVAVESAILVD
jgi:hypothetical protein